ncbi:hypothetical protein JTE90_001576 [Oedothorax gibbosus]|uniref:BTB domain-containing protein n=1 Tax=Oedothorax gibbosus TaxID=931172 RepID=A0AAV6VLS5_9ARAC|nr:hypothetical protein JTE90_001576 [Oedothorax gibbosus]
MLNSKSDIRSRSSSPIPPSLEKNDVVADIISPPTLARHQTVVEEDEHHTRLGEHAAVLWKFNKMTDITVKLNEEKYPAHKTVLSCYSRYFKEELLKSDKNVSVINLQLEGVTNEAFSVLLRYMYTADLELNCQNLGDVYTAARKLRMDEAIDACTKIVEGKDRHEVHSVYVFVTAKKLGLQEKASSALRSMCRRFEHIAGTQEFLDLTCEQVMEYLSQDELATRSEVVVYLSALKWLSVRYLDREQDCVRVVACVRFPMMNLNEVLACHTPPLLPGIVELPAIKNMLLTATCFIASKTINQEKLFQRYNCPERTYLLKRETISLWDPSIFDPDCHALYAKGVAASTIQARFRDYKTNKAKKQAAEVIQKAYRHLSHGHDPNHPYSSSEDDEFEKVSEDIDAGDRNSSGIIAPLAEKIRSTVTGLFGSSSQPRESDEKFMQARKELYRTRR